MRRDGRKDLILLAKPESVRAALSCVFPADGALCDDGRDVAELVLAEVLNNVVEHAYGGQGGEILLTLRWSGRWLAVRVADTGRPYPDGVLPPDMPFPDPVADPCDGGFGWGLIRALATRIAYRRAGRWNVLILRIPMDNAAAAA